MGLEDGFGGLGTGDGDLWDAGSFLYRSISERRFYTQYLAYKCITDYVLALFLPVGMFLEEAGSETERFFSSSAYSVDRHRFDVSFAHDVA